MSAHSRKSKSLKFLLVANLAFFLCSYVIFALTSVVSLSPSTSSDQISSEAYQTAFNQILEDIDKTYADQLSAAQHQIKEKDKALKSLRDELVNGYVVVKDLQVTDSKHAYWLAEPKLMLGVHGLPGGRLHISFADRTDMISVGERIDFQFEDCDCFLILKSSTYGKADFRFACARTVAKQVVNL